MFCQRMRSTKGSTTVNRKRRRRGQKRSPQKKAHFSCVGLTAELQTATLIELTAAVKAPVGNAK